MRSGCTRSSPILADNPKAEVRRYETGHFTLETHHREIAGAIRDFLDRQVGSKVANA